jgi:hypothetical protein
VNASASRGSGSTSTYSMNRKSWKVERYALASP